MENEKGGVSDAAALIGQISVLLKSLTADEIDQLVAGRAKLAVVPKASRGSAGRGVLSETEVETIRERLLTASSREDGHSYLEGLDLNRRALTDIAQALDLPVRKADKLDDLRRNIVDATIGFRLRSDAIRGRPGS